MKMWIQNYFLSAVQWNSKNIICLEVRSHNSVWFYGKLKAIASMEIAFMQRRKENRLKFRAVCTQHQHKQTRASSFVRSINLHSANPFLAAYVFIYFLRLVQLLIRAITIEWNKNCISHRMCTETETKKKNGMSLNWISIWKSIKMQIHLPS